MSHEGHYTIRCIESLLNSDHKVIREGWDEKDLVDPDVILEAMKRSPVFKVPAVADVDPRNDNCWKLWNEMLEVGLPVKRMPFAATCVEFDYLNNYAGDDCGDRRSVAFVREDTVGHFRTLDPDFAGADEDPAWCVRLFQEYRIDGLVRWLPCEIALFGFEMVPSEQSSFGFAPLLKAWRLLPIGDQNDAGGLLGISAVVSLVVALACKNVEKRLVAPSEKLNRARVKRGRMPFASFYTLVLKSDGEPIGNWGSDRQSPAMHAVRGHIRRLKSEKQFTFVRPYVAGNPKRGIVQKDYDAGELEPVE